MSALANSHKVCEYQKAINSEIGLILSVYHVRKLCIWSPVSDQVILCLLFPASGERIRLVRISKSISAVHIKSSLKT